MNTHWRKGTACWRAGGTLYMSIVFSWDLPEARRIAARHKGPVVVGGPAAATHRAAIDWATVADDSPFDTLAAHNPFATFTTRGCVRRCEFCVVSRVEGEFRELGSWKPAPIVCDNNLTAASRAHFERVIESVRRFPYVDINQGMDARLFTKWHAEQLQKLPGVKIRFALDSASVEGKVADAIALCRGMGFHDFGRYVLVGFNDTPAEARTETSVTVGNCRCSVLRNEASNGICLRMWFSVIGLPVNRP